MKTKKNKKYYNFTEYQKRKDWHPKTGQNASSGYRKMFNKELKAKNRHVLQRILQGDDVEFIVEIKDVNWYWF